MQIKTSYKKASNFELYRHAVLNDTIQNAGYVDTESRHDKPPSISSLLINRFALLGLSFCLIIGILGSYSELSDLQTQDEPWTILDHERELIKDEHSVRLFSESKALSVKTKQKINHKQLQTDTLRDLRMHNVYRSLKLKVSNSPYSIYPQYKQPDRVSESVSNNTSLIQHWEASFQSAH